jgi:hypothetical protein
MMSEEEKKEEEENIENERQKLAELGLNSTWDLLSSDEKIKKKEQEKKPFIGFK